MQRIDAHHHLWRYTPEEYDWIDGRLLPLRRDFLLNALHTELAAAQVDGTVAVQARQTAEETEWLLQLAEQDPSILGVVGWLPIAETGFAPLLHKLQTRALLKGLRHVVQAEAPGFLDRADFNGGIRQMRGSGLAYDLLIQAWQLAECTRFVDRHPEQVFVLDHLAKPEIAGGEIAAWGTELRELARRPQVFCKVSGMVTEADPTCWTPAQLAPYFEVALEAFGPDRLMIGSDWPVLTIGCAYAQWWSIVEKWVISLSDMEQAAILGGTAARVYRLFPPG